MSEFKLYFNTQDKIKYLKAAGYEIEEVKYTGSRNIYHNDTEEFEAIAYRITKNNKPIEDSACARWPDRPERWDHELDVYFSRLIYNALLKLITIPTQNKDIADYIEIT